MGYYRQNISGGTPRDIKITNDNFQQIWSKVFGDITFSDTNRTLQKQILTQWVPVQGEGNLDSKYPLYLRFFVPPDVEEIKSTNFNIIIENYRMDSAITSTTDSTQTGTSTTSSTAPQYSKTSSTAPQYTKTSSSAPQYSSTSTSSAVGGTSASGGGSTQEAKSWGRLTGGSRYPAPSENLVYNEVMVSSGGYYVSTDTKRLAVPQAYIMYGGEQKEVIDMNKLQHQHDIPSHTHSVSLGSHSHSITVNAHTHDLTINSHTHDITIDSHKHDVQMQITIPGHKHDLDEGIKVTTTAPSNVVMYLNDVKVSNSISGNGTSQLNIDVKDNVKIGTWNTIKITSSNIARASIFGTLELVIKR